MIITIITFSCSILVNILEIQLKKIVASRKGFRVIFACGIWNPGP